MAGTVDEGPVLRLRPEAVAWRNVEGEVVALDLARSEYLTVNATGRVLWDALADGATEQEIVRRIVASFAVDEATAAADVAALLAELRTRGIVTP